MNPKVTLEEVELAYRDAKARSGDFAPIFSDYRKYDQALPIFHELQEGFNVAILFLQAGSFEQKAWTIEFLYQVNRYDPSHKISRFIFPYLLDFIGDPANYRSDMPGADNIRYFALSLLTCEPWLLHRGDLKTVSSAFATIALNASLDLDLRKLAYLSLCRLHNSKTSKRVSEALAISVDERRSDFDRNYLVSFL